MNLKENSRWAPANGQGLLERPEDLSVVMKSAKGPYRAHLEALIESPDSPSYFNSDSYTATVLGRLGSYRKIRARTLTKIDIIRSFGGRCTAEL